MSASDADQQGTSCRRRYFFAALIFAHLAFWAAAILALPAALILRLDFGAATEAAGLFEEPKILCNLFWSDWILSLMLAARLNCLAERFAIEFMPFNYEFYLKKSTIGCRRPLLLSLDPDSNTRAPEWQRFRESPLPPALVIKNLKLFFALQTLNENGVEVENQPSRPA